MPYSAASLSQGAFAHFLPKLGSGLSVTTPYPDGQQGLPGAEPQSAATAIHLKAAAHNQMSTTTGAGTLCFPWKTATQVDVLSLSSCVSVLAQYADALHLLGQ